MAHFAVNIMLGVIFGVWVFYLMNGCWEKHERELQRESWCPKSCVHPRRVDHFAVTRFFFMWTWVLFTISLSSLANFATTVVLDNMYSNATENRVGGYAALAFLAPFAMLVSRGVLEMGLCIYEMDFAREVCDEDKVVK